jgi:hypothetical protein
MASPLYLEFESGRLTMYGSTVARFASAKQEVLGGCF